jgi:hypothetical protein
MVQAPSASTIGARSKEYKRVARRRAASSSNHFNVHRVSKGLRVPFFKEESDTRGATEVGGVQEFRYFAGGEWRAAENNKLFDVYVCRPFDRRLYARTWRAHRSDHRS